MEKRAEINAALKEALRNKDQVALATVRLMLAAMKDRDINAREKGNMDGIGDAEILSMLQSMIKQRLESSKTYRDAGRADLADKEDEEIKVIERFLPAQLDDKEVADIIGKLIRDLGATDIKDMGRVMAEMKTRFAGQIDMAKAGAVVKQKLTPA